ncbi:MAG: PDZ domain-containing protein [Planctomycetota bacterium]|nr:PDZ domain-containing protein [Planctomycetota bacterium]
MIASRGGWNKTVKLTLGSSNPEAAPTPAPEVKPSGDAPGFLGVYLSEDQGAGAVIDGTLKDSAARKAGFKKGDVIVKVNGKVIKTTQDLIGQLKGLKAGAKVNMTVVRDGWGKKVVVTLGERPQPKPAAKQRGFFGVALDEANGKVTVDEVQAGSPADKTKMAKGDVMISVNGKKINSIDDFAAALKGKYAGDKLTVVISRDGWKRTVTVTLAASDK